MIKNVLLDLDFTLHNGGVLYPDTISFLKFLRLQGYKIGVLTVGDNTSQNLVVDHLGLRELIDFVWTCNLKDMDVYHKIFKSFGMSPNETIVIGDNEEYDFKSANNMGVLTIKVNRGPFKDVRLHGSYCASMEVNSFEELEKLFVPKKVLLVPYRNSIVSTAENVLKHYPFIKLFKGLKTNPLDYYDCVLPLSNDILETFSLLNVGNIVVSPTYTIKCCVDKKKFEGVFGGESFYPIAVKGKNAVFKPVVGSGSKGVLFEVYNKGKKGFIVQKFISGEELTVDCLFKSGELMNFAVRERNEVWNGISTLNIFKPQYKKDLKLLLNIICKKLVFDGPVNIQFIKDDKGKFWLTEINPRTCSNMCYGGSKNFILNAVLQCVGKNCDYSEIKTNMVDRWLSWSEY